ncbi:MAG: hypothetical protein Tsb0032_26340 [Kiloniellaceae bacterium]
MRAVLPTLSLLILLAGPAQALDCSEAAEAELQRLAITRADIADLRYEEKYNPSESGPDVLGVRAWVKLEACATGNLVIDMTRTCFVRQSYTRGSCHLKGVTAY